MARIPGRNAWLAWPAGLLCATIVAALVWLALPMVPVAITWAGDTLRAATWSPVAASEGEAGPPLLEEAESDRALDCRRLYPDDLWAEIVWRPQALLTQNLAPPTSSVAALTEALAPQVRVTCVWRFDDGGTIATTLARVSADAAPVAEAALRGQAFECATTGDILHCTRSRAGVVEQHALRGELWLSSVVAADAPDAYGDRLAAELWGGE